MALNYVAIYDANNNGIFWKNAAVAIVKQRLLLLANASPTVAAIAWCNRELETEARRICPLLLGTAPIAAKVVSESAIADADWDTALAAIIGNILKAVS